MRYSEIDMLENQIQENAYEDVVNHSNLKENFFIHANDFYKIFYIFIIGSIFGCYMEQIQYYIKRDIWECRAGVIWGPFSEVYGLGAIIIFIIYRKMKQSSPLTIFGVSLICGSAFEYFARLFQEIAFHSITWDYSKQPLNFGGRTSLKYATYWGILGLIFIKCIFPLLDKQLENVRGKMAFAFTWVFIIFMTLNLMFSAISVNRWNERLQGIPPQNNLEQYIDSHYGNTEMKELFPHMKFMEAANKS